MINTLLGKIANLFEKDFLFAAFLPSLIFCSVIASTVGGVLGIGTLWLWVDSWTASQKASSSVAVSVFLVVFAYIIHAARPGFISIWSGKHDFFLLWPFFSVATWLQQRRFRKMEENASRVSPWRAELETFRVNTLAVWRGLGFPAIPDANNQALLRAIRNLDRSSGVTAVRAALQDLITNYFALFEGTSVSPAYKQIKDKLLRWESAEEFGLQGAASDVDREYGVFETIHPTRLGNVIESYNFYSYKRYRIETEIFWPRLRAVIKPEYLGLVDGSRILLDFSLAMATLSLLYAILVIFVGPWMWYAPRLWMALCLAGLVGCLAFYRLAVAAAEQFGDMVRSCFDLFRLDLLRMMGLNDPESINRERALWEQASKLVVYGQGFNDFDLRKRAP